MNTDNKIIEKRFMDNSNGEIMNTDSEIIEKRFIDDSNGEIMNTDNKIIIENPRIIIVRK